MNAQELFQRLLAENPYPMDVFPRYESKDIEKITKLFKENNLSMDRYSGHLMRMAWWSCAEKALEIMQEEEK